MNYRKRIKRIWHWLVRPSGRWKLLFLLEKFLKIRMDDEEYLKGRYKMIFGRDLNLETPLTFNEKLQWLKLYNRKPLYTTMVDKYEVKKYVANIIGEQYIVPTFGVWDNFNKIDFNQLPNQFVLKCTHDSGSVCVCKNKDEFDIVNASKKLTLALKRNYYWWGREWPYKGVKPKILAEKYMQNGDTTNLEVYKFFCFAGVPKIIQVIQDDKTVDESIDYFDTNWNKLNLRQNFPNSAVALPRPEPLRQMVEIAAKLSDGIPFVRTDLYVVNGSVYFSEFTFFSDNGMATFEPEKWDAILGGWLNLPGCYKN